MNYTQKLKDPRWQKKRLEVMERDQFTCQHCLSKKKTLHIHHLIYFKNYEPWDYDNEYLITLCEPCHGRVEDLKKLVGLLALNKSILDRLWAICEAHGESVDRMDTRKPLAPTPESAEACFKAMRDAVEEVAA